MRLIGILLCVAIPSLAIAALAGCLDDLKSQRPQAIDPSKRVLDDRGNYFTTYELEDNVRCYIYAGRSVSCVQIITADTVRALLAKK